MPQTRIHYSHRPFWQARNHGFSLLSITVLLDNRISAKAAGSQQNRNGWFRGKSSLLAVNVTVAVRLIRRAQSCQGFILDTLSISLFTTGVRGKMCVHALLVWWSCVLNLTDCQVKSLVCLVCPSSCEITPSQLSLYIHEKQFNQKWNFCHNLLILMSLKPYIKTRFTVNNVIWTSFIILYFVGLHNILRSVSANISDFNLSVSDI